MRTSILLLFLLAFGLRAQPGNPPISIQRVTSPIVLDGHITEPAWDPCKPVALVMHMPHFDQEPTQRSEILLAFDDDYLYVGARLFDTEPARILHGSRKRDEMSLSMDFIGILLDTFNDKEHALGFFTTPSGLRTDLTIFNDALGDEPVSGSWNTYWEVETSVGNEGWYAEFRIPFTSLRFQDRGGTVTMGMILWRWIARNNESNTFPSISPKWGWWSQVKPSQAQEIVFEGLHSRNPLYVTPYVLGGLGQSNELNDAETAYVRDRTFQREAGLDVKYGLTSNLTLDVTLNTDFARVEADDQQVNLTRFSLFFPEKRLFFQERSSIYDFSLGGQNRLFYSRRIGLYEEDDEDRTVRIYGGARVIGRVGSWDVGFLDMQTASVANRRSENFGVLRLRRQVFNPYSYLGAMATNRIQSDGTFNTTYGLDGIIRVFGDDYLNAVWAQSFGSGLKNDPVSLAPSRIWLEWNRRSVDGFAYSASFTRGGVDFDPRMGFDLRTDFTQFGGGVKYGWLPESGSPLFRHQAKVEGFVFLRNEDRSVESMQVGPAWELSFRSGFFLLLGAYLYKEDVREEFELSDEVHVPVGTYSFASMNAYVLTPQGERFYVEGDAAVGSYYDGSQISFRVTPYWTMSTDLQLSGTYRIDHIRFPERDQLFVAHIARLRALLTLTTTFSLSTFLQYNSAADLAVFNVRLRYNPREGNDLYLVYNETLFTNRTAYSPVRPASGDRAVLLKYSHTFLF